MGLLSLEVFKVRLAKHVKNNIPHAQLPDVTNICLGHFLITVKCIIQAF